MNQTEKMTRCGYDVATAARRMLPGISDEQVAKLVSLNERHKIDLTTWSVEPVYPHPPRENSRPCIIGKWIRMTMMIEPNGDSHT